MNSFLINERVLKEVNRYLSISFKNVTFAAPYAINEFGLALKKLLSENNVDGDVVKEIYEKFTNRESAYGWYAGKATAQQLTDAIPELLERTEIPAHDVRAYSVLEMMKLYGLGVDCSGFVFNVLSAATEEQRSSFIDSLDWRSDKHDVMHAGTFVFAGKASELVEPKDVRPLDLILIKSGEEYVHIALIVERNGELRLVQSSLLNEPSGVSETSFAIIDEKPVFEIKQGLGSNWNDLVKSEALEFRRLNIFE